MMILRDSLFSAAIQGSVDAAAAMKLEIFIGETLLIQWEVTV